MSYCCTQCGAVNVQWKTKSNYGCMMSAIDLMFFVLAFFTCGVTLLGCLMIHCCVKKTKVCPKCECENCLVPTDSVKGRALIREFQGDSQQ